MTPTLEEAYLKFKAHEIEAGQQILIKLLNEEPGNDDAWKMLIESYQDPDMKFQLASEYFNLTGGSQKASQTLLGFYKKKNEQFLIDETSDKRWVEKIDWLGIIPGVGRVKWSKALLIKMIFGLAAFLLLTNLLWLGGSISAANRREKLQLDFNRLSGVYSDQILDYSTLGAQYSELQLQYSDLQTAYLKLEAAYKTLVAGTTAP
jgi:hypothetical protein